MTPLGPKRKKSERRHLPDPGFLRLPDAAGQYCRIIVDNFTRLFVGKKIHLNPFFFLDATGSR